MADIVTLVAQVSAPVKAAWLLWLVWVVLQVASYRLVRQQSLPSEEPASAQSAAPAAAMSSRRRRRRRVPPQHEPGALQEIEA